MQRPYRIIVWGPGTLGNICIREVTRMPEFELVGVRAYSPSKDGVDAGEIAGIGPIGIKATTNEQALLALECDCIVHTARDSADYQANAEILRLLRAGRNVVTILPYQHIEFVGEACDPGFEAELRAACEAGRSVFHSTGIHPEMVVERLAAAATGLCTDVKSIRVEENWDLSHMRPETLGVAGYGLPVEEAKKNPIVAHLSNNYCRQNFYGLAKTLGVKLDRVTVDHDYVPAPEDLHFESMTVRKGCVARLSHLWQGWSDAIGPDPFLVIEINWMMGHGPMLPKGVDPEYYYVITIEGTPSVKLAIDIKSSMVTRQRRVKPDDSTSEAGFYACIATVLQSVPFVCASKPGILPVYQPRLHWTPDFRNLAPRT